MCRLTIDFCQLINIPPQVSKTASALMTGALWGKLLRNYQVFPNYSTLLCDVILCVD